MRRTLFATCMLLSVASCKKEFTASTSKNASGLPEEQTVASGIITTPATYFDSLFTRYEAGQWTGGDVASSYKLPDGRSFWLFGDSFVDTVYADRHRPFDPFIHNSIVLTDASANFITTLYGGTAQNPKPFFNAAEPKQYWPNCAFSNTAQNQLYVMMATIKATGEGGLFGFKVTGNSVGVLSLPDCKLLKIFDVSKDPAIDWSSATFEEGDYVYIYGAESTKYNKFIHIARTRRSQPFRSIEYYNGAAWVKDPSQSARIQGGVSEQYSVFKFQNKYYLLSQANLLGADIYLWDAASPVGPFINKRKIYHTPQAGGNIITYNATAHTEYIQNNRLLVGYCTNSFHGLDIYKNADNYRPYFVWVSGWQ